MQLKKNLMNGSKEFLVASIPTVMVKSATKSTYAQYNKKKVKRRRKRKKTMLLKKETKIAKRSERSQGG